MRRSTEETRGEAHCREAAWSAAHAADQSQDHRCEIPSSLPELCQMSRKCKESRDHEAQEKYDGGRYEVAFVSEKDRY